MPEYEQNLVNLIKDVRKELKAPNLPVVIGELTGPWVDAPGEWATLRKAQAAAAARPEFKGNVLFVETHDFVRPAKESPNPGHGHHEFGNAETYFLVGDALGKGMIKLLTPASRRRRPSRRNPRRTRSRRSKAGPSAWMIGCCRAPDDELGTRALRFLEAKLSDIKAVVPADKVKKLQAVTIVLDLTHGKLGPMQYHPNAGWLKANGYSPDLAKCVHLPRAADLATKRNINEQPWVILHELAHAYHDQVLGFDEPRDQGGLREVQEERPRREDAALQRQAREALRADRPQGVLRRDDGELLRRQRLLPVQPRRAEGGRAGDLRTDGTHLGHAREAGGATEEVLQRGRACGLRHHARAGR